MSNLFGVFWHARQPVPSALLDAWKTAAASRPMDGGCTPHLLSNAFLLVPDQALAQDSESILVFQGELRNHADLAHAADCPPEIPAAVLVHRLLKKYSFDEVLARLNGPFVIAYYDLPRQKLHLVRDHLGQRFLFHTTLTEYGCTLFSDALPRLTALPGLSRQLDYAAIADFLSLGYIPSPRTAYAQIHKVPPGTEVVIDSAGTTVQQRHWRPSFLPTSSLSWNEAHEEALHLLNQATRRLAQQHPEADFMLSGGIDSGMVMGLASHVAPDPTRRAHTIAFNESAYDESEYAAGTAERCDVPLQIHRLSPADLASLDTLIETAGEPYADSSLLPTAAATRATSRKALFTGDGGDEVFGGYRRYQAMLLRSRIPGWLQWLVRYPCRWAAAMLPNPRDNRSRMANLVRSLRSMGLPPLAAYGSFQQIASKSLRERLLAFPQSQDYLQDWEKLVDGIAASYPVLKYNALDLMVYLPDDGFRKTSLASEGTGVSYLCPILDMDVVRFALSLPLAYRFNTQENKRILRRIGQDFLDPRILTQPKRGFGTPVADWFRKELAPVAQKLADEQPDWDIYNLLNNKELHRIVSEHLQGKASHGPLIWSLYCLRLWEQKQVP